MCTNLHSDFFLSTPIYRADTLNHIPGAIMISIVAPTVINGGIADFVAGLTTLFAIARTGNLVLAMFTGVTTVWILRNYFHV